MRHYSDYAALCIDQMLADPTVRTATKVLAPRLTVRVSRRLYQGHNKKMFAKKVFEFVVTIGRPNFETREFIKSCIKAGEPFPVNKIRLTHVRQK